MPDFRQIIAEVSDMFIVKNPVELLGIATVKTDAPFGTRQQLKKTAFKNTLQVQGDIEMVLT